ncbi:hypothetical protein PMI23_02641, partial [Pseudomonas sp. GM24]
MRGFFLRAGLEICTWLAPHPSPLPRERELTEMSGAMHRPEKS